MKKILLFLGVSVLILSCSKQGENQITDYLAQTVWTCNDDTFPGTIKFLGNGKAVYTPSYTVSMNGKTSTIASKEEFEGTYRIIDERKIALDFFISLTLPAELSYLSAGMRLGDIYLTEATYSLTTMTVIGKFIGSGDFGLKDKDLSLIYKKN